MGIVSLSRLLGEVCEGSIRQDGLRFKVQKIKGLPLYAFPIFHKSCSWRRFEKDLKLGYRDLIQIGGFGFEVGETKNWAPSTDCSTTIAKIGYFHHRALAPEQIHNLELLRLTDVQELQELLIKPTG
ncbi:hypothetical protein D8674_008073 [Pyrus ussuriensis x Pyrus communis]|uniref:Uncharacterized protein n=1 Tax=Pyrus ussuriensis x Pyrus communis TaxID=2448454 RepID=A0A5N5I4M6_9ROSA|nr:hypothetical protein D8674_008073 [Pyrus ussuriensis x Pyrus communis]